MSPEQCDAVTIPARWMSAARPSLKLSRRREPPSADGSPQPLSKTSLLIRTDCHFARVGPTTPKPSGAKLPTRHGPDWIPTILYVCHLRFVNAYPIGPPKMLRGEDELIEPHRDGGLPEVVRGTPTRRADARPAAAINDRPRPSSLPRSRPGLPRVSRARRPRGPRKEALRGREGVSPVFSGPLPT
jgi:hypothetical protein